jgi:hypothetical protein
VQITVEPEQDADQGRHAEPNRDVEDVHTGTNQHHKWQSADCLDRVSPWPSAPPSGPSSVFRTSNRPQGGGKSLGQT